MSITYNRAFQKDKSLPLESQNLITKIRSLCKRSENSLFLHSRGDKATQIWVSG